MTHDCSFIRTAHGVRVEYAEQGRDGPPLLMLHGYSDSQHSFDLLRMHLPARMFAVAMSMRGHGQTDAPAGGYAIGDLAADAIALLDELNIGRAIIVGHSLGSSVALEIGAAYPERVAGLALLAAFANYEHNGPAHELMGEVAALTDPVDPAFARAFQESTLANPTPDGFLDMAISESLRLSARTWRAVGEGFMAFDPPAAAARCRAPALILWGDRDLFVPREDATSLANALPWSRLRVLQGVGHAVHWEKPADVAREIASFAADIAETNAPVRSVA